MEKGDIVKFKEATNEQDRMARMLLLEDPDGFPKVLVQNLAHGGIISQAVWVSRLVKVQP